MKLSLWHLQRRLVFSLFVYDLYHPIENIRHKLLLNSNISSHPVSACNKKYLLAVHLTTYALALWSGNSSCSSTNNLCSDNFTPSPTTLPHLSVLCRWPTIPGRRFSWYMTPTIRTEKTSTFVSLRKARRSIWRLSRRRRKRQRRVGLVTDFVSGLFIEVLCWL